MFLICAEVIINITKLSQWFTSQCQWPVPNGYFPRVLNLSLEILVWYQCTRLLNFLKLCLEIVTWLQLFLWKFLLTVLSYLVCDSKLKFWIDCWTLFLEMEAIKTANFVKIFLHFLQLESTSVRCQFTLFEAYYGIPNAM